MAVAVRLVAAGGIAWWGEPAGPPGTLEGVPRSPGGPHGMGISPEATPAALE